MIYACTVCNKRRATRRVELSWQELASGARPVPYVAVIRDDSPTVAATIAGTAHAYACALCVDEHDSPGAFEQYRHDRHALGLALILEAWSNDGAEDDRMYSEGWGSCERFGRFLFTVDTSGFRSFEEYATDAKAEEEFTRYYLAGWGASEFDAYVSQEWNGRGDVSGWHVSFDGKSLDLWPRNDGTCDERRALARVRLEMMRTGYYPDVWRQGERGDVSHVSNI